MNAQYPRRATRRPALPTAVLWLALSAGFASVGQAEEILPETTVTAVRLDTPAQAIREELAATTRDAAWRTRIHVASRLSARLNLQRRPYRLAGRENRFWDRTG